MRNLIKSSACKILSTRLISSQIFLSIFSIKPYEGDYVINTDNKSVQQIVDEIKVIVDSEGNE